MGFTAEAPHSPISSYADCIFFNGLTQHNGKWWVYYGGSEYNTCLANAPIRKRSSMVVCCSCLSTEAVRYYYGGSRKENFPAAEHAQARRWNQDTRTAHSSFMQYRRRIYAYDTDRDC